MEKKFYSSKQQFLLLFAYQMHKLKKSLSHDYTNSINNLMEILHFKIVLKYTKRSKSKIEKVSETSYKFPSC